MINFRFEVHNKGGHSSLPVPDNAIYHLAGALDRLSKFGFPLKTNEVTRAYFAAMATIDTGARSKPTSPRWPMVRPRDGSGSPRSRQPGTPRCARHASRRSSKAVMP